MLLVIAAILIKWALKRMVYIFCLLTLVFLNQGGNLFFQRIQFRFSVLPGN